MPNTDILQEKVRDITDTLLSYETISSHPIGQKFPLTEGVNTCRLADNSEGVIFFKVEMKKGSLVHAHHHNCVEDTVLFSGKVLEVINNKFMPMNKITRLKAGNSHLFYAMEDSVFYVQTYPPNMNLNKPCRAVRK